MQPLYRTQLPLPLDLLECPMLRMFTSKIAPTGRIKEWAWTIQSLRHPETGAKLRSLSLWTASTAFGYKGKFRPLLQWLPPVSTSNTESSMLLVALSAGSSIGNQDKLLFSLLFPRTIKYAWIWQILIEEATHIRWHIYMPRACPEKTLFKLVQISDVSSDAAASRCEIIQSIL